jgi:hypothetical protein
MYISVVPDNTLTGRVIRRHLSGLGHSIIDRDPTGAAVSDAPERAADVVIFNLTAVSSSPCQSLAKMACSGSAMCRIAILRQDQSLALDDALAYGIQAILHEPLRLQELELALMRSPMNSPKEVARKGNKGEETST